LSIFGRPYRSPAWGALPRVAKIEEKAPNPISKLISPYDHSDETPQVSFADKIYYHSISPQLQMGVTGYARLLDLANIKINTDDEKSKQITEDWIDMTDFRTKLEAMGNTFLICGNSILEKLSDKNTEDVAEVDMSTIVGKKRNEFGETEYYTQLTRQGPTKLGETGLNRFIEFNLNTISRSTWSPCIFESAVIPRKVGGRTTRPLVELVVAIEDAMSTIILNNAYPEVYYTFENVGEEEIRLEAEKIRKRKPGDRMIVTKQPKIDMFEAKGQSAYVDYIKYLYNSLSASIKYPIDIINGDFTSRASSETSEGLPEKISAAIKRYIGSKLKQELFDPILAQNGIDPKLSNLQITFGVQEVIPLTASDVGSRFKDGIWTVEEVREWDKDNTGVDLFDDDKINNDQKDQEKKAMQDQFNNKALDPKTTVIKKRAEEIKKEFMKKNGE